MSGDSKIEWTDKTWNPVAGCDRVSPGCDHCYAETIATRFAGSKAFPNGFAVTLHPDRLTDPLKWRKPAKVFVNSMSDLFHDEIEDQFIEAVIQTMTITPQHSYQVLTKRPQRMAKVLQRLSWDCNGDAHIGQFTADELGLGDNEYYDVGAHLPNVWWGTSIESDRYAFRANHLRNTPAAVRFLSLEPLLGPLPSLDLTDIDWVIVGGESGHGARPMDVAWVRELRDRCVDASVPFFFKQWGEWCPDFAIDPTTGMGVQCSESMTRLGKKNSGRDLDGRTWDEYPVTESADFTTP